VLRRIEPGRALPFLPFQPEGKGGKRREKQTSSDSYMEQFVAEGLSEREENELEAEGQSRRTTLM